MGPQSFRRWRFGIAMLATLAVTALVAPDSRVRAADTTTARAAEWQRSGEARAAAGDWAGALEAWKKAESLGRSPAGRSGTADGQQRARLLLQMAGAYHTLGLRREADSAVSAARGLAGTDPGLRSAVDNLQGVVSALWDPPAAGLALDRSVQAAREAGDPVAEARAEANRGLVLSLRGEPTGAMAAWRRSAELAAGRDETLEVQSLVNAAAAQVGRDGLAGGREVLETAAGRVARLPEGAASAGLWLRLASAVSTATGEAPAASPLIASALAWVGRADEFGARLAQPRWRSQAAGLRAALLARQGAGSDERLRELASAIHHAQSAGAGDLLFRWEWALGRVLREAGRSGDSLAPYRRAIRTVEDRTLRHDLAVSLGQRYGAAGFREHLGPLFYEVADLLIRSTEGERDPARVQERLAEAREVMELLKSAELEDYFQDPCQIEGQARVKAVDAVSPATAVLYPIALPDRLEWLVTLPGGRLERIPVPVSAEELGREVRDLGVGLRVRSSFEFMGPAQRLHERLMKDLDPLLASAGVRTLVLVPDGVLRTAPLGALHDGTNFLAARYTLAVSPGLTLMDPRPRGEWTRRMLAAGLSEARPGFRALPSVELEMTELDRILHGRSLLNRTFTEERMRSEFARGSFSVVHLATHGKFESEASRSFLLTFDSRLGLDGLESLIRPARFRGQAVELLALSACQTAAGDDRAALGLAGVAIKAGARSALATLWCVNDEAAAGLVASFYEELGRDPKASKAQALQRAQLRLMQDPNLRHPYYWSPYLMIGNWL